MTILSEVILGILMALNSVAYGQQNALHPKFESALPNEAEFRQEIIRGILHLQEKQAQESHGPKLRGTHAKGVCAKADFEILNNGNGLNEGIFAFPGVYPATVRFANARGEIHPDQKSDVRSMSFAVEMPTNISNPQGRMDFSTNDATTFPINDADAFAALMTLLRLGPIEAPFELGFRRSANVGELLIRGALQQRPLYAPYQKIRYWSGVPFLFGDNQAIKYSLKPCAQNSAAPLTDAPNTLSEELARHLKNDEVMSCFEFQVQLLDEGMAHHLSPFPIQEWIENATWEWPENQMPFHTVAKLTLKKDSLIPAEECEAIRMNVNINTTPEHRGLGSINRGRTGAEQSSAQNR